VDTVFEKLQITKSDLDDVRLSRPVSVTDLWDIDDRIARLERIAERLEQVVIAFGELYREERVKGWELILRQMMKAEDVKRGRYGNRTG